MSKRVVVPCRPYQKHRWRWEYQWSGDECWLERRCRRCRREFSEVLG